MKRFTCITAGALALFVILAAISPIGVPKALAQIRATVIKNIDEPGRIPYQAYVHAYSGVNSPCGANYCEFHLSAVPAGKRLVLTNVSVRAILPQNVIVGDAELYVYDAMKNDFTSFLSLSRVEAGPQDPILANNRLTVYNQQVQFYVEAGQAPTLFFWTLGGNLSTYEQRGMVTGYLVDLAS